MKKILTSFLAVGDRSGEAVTLGNIGVLFQSTNRPAYVFERAGAKAVMASLWAVDDEATQQLMVQFYQNLKQGMTKGKALQKAKLKLIAHHRHAYYWSPFVLIGDAR
ncbi:MAG: CHAT domain-containing protein [Nostoc sp.]|uniref:CHAT domain-containing protein n=1 Tax=Nostoc sp. TaxID=1180 RepID=UPI002FF48879